MPTSDPGHYDHQPAMLNSVDPLTSGLSINAVAPIRICDIGGWTDTWFARSGAVFNIAIYPYVEVQIRPTRTGPGSRSFTLAVENYGDTYALEPSNLTLGKHPLLEAALDIMDLPEDVSLEINIFSEAPPGAATGTSAAVSVALIGALDRLTRGRLCPHEVAALAHSIETEKLGLQSGIQDQLASAYGGINFIEMHAYPHASVSGIQLPNPVWWELEQRLSVVYIGSPHNSSEIHRRVIEKLGERAHESPLLREMTGLAREAKNALYEASFPALGEVMNRNTELQRQLHPGLVCDRFEEIIALAGDFGALGCKVNGAGGDGGSVTILSDGDMAQKRRMLKAISACSYSVLPFYLSRQGLRVWE